MSYEKRLQEEIVSRLSNKPKKSSKLKHITKLDKYHERMKTGK